MSDERGLPRGSKALTVVVFVVFFQVLVVAVFGLNSMLGDRAEAEQKALEQANAKARATLGDLVKGVGADLRRLLDGAAQIGNAEELQKLARESPDPPVRAIYHVNPETREVWWIDGEHRLHVPVEERDAQTQEQHASAAERDVETLRPIDFIREYPYLLEERGYPRAVGKAISLLEALDVDAEPIAEGKEKRAYHDRRQYVLAALEVATLSRDNPRVFDAPLIDKLEQAVDTAIAGFSPPRRREGEADEGADARGPLADEVSRLADALRFEAAAYRKAREGLHAQGFLEALVSVLPEATVDPRVRPRGEHLIGLVATARDGRDAVVRLDPASVRRRVEDRVDLAALEELGVEMRVVDDSSPENLAALQTRPLTALGLPLRVELHRVRPPVSTGFGPSALFYWGIIAGAAGGLALGGYVLVRTLRREMRLARLKADFVGNLSHELKTPLTSIAMFTEMLREGKLSSPEDREEAYDVLTQEANRLQRIVGRMIDTARRETQTEPTALRPGDLNRPVREAAHRLRRIVTEPGLDLILDLAPKPLPVLLDEAAMDDAVTNLLSNSWKYRQGERARIVVRTARQGRKAEVVVSDDGIGIPRHERRKVFEMFYRAEQYLTRAVPGTGLGLALVRTIVRSHRGSVRIEGGEGGRGTVFRLRFPLTREPLPAATNAATNAATTRVGSAQAPATPSPAHQA